MKKINKSIVLLSFVNFILTATLMGNKVIAMDNTYKDEKIPVTLEYAYKNGKSINTKDLLEQKSQLEEYVGCEIIEGETIVVMKKEKAIQLEQEKIIQAELARQREEARLEAIRIAKTIETSRVTSIEDINVFTDLSHMNTIDTDQMNHIINYWSSKTNTTFTGHGQVFIDAGKSSGLDPVYILAHAAIESGWGTKNMSHNYFGIGAFDSNPSNGHNYGNRSLSEGIINGATWIARNFYNIGQTSLYSMRYNNGKHEYCTSTTWMYDIAHIMQVSYDLIY